MNIDDMLASPEGKALELKYADGATPSSIASSIQKKYVVFLKKIYG